MPVLPVIHQCTKYFLMESAGTFAIKVFKGLHLEKRKADTPTHSIWVHYESLRCFWNECQVSQSAFHCLWRCSGSKMLSKPNLFWQLLQWTKHRFVSVRMTNSMRSGLRVPFPMSDPCVDPTRNLASLHNDLLNAQSVFCEVKALWGKPFWKLDVKCVNYLHVSCSSDWNKPDKIRLSAFNANSNMTEVRSKPAQKIWLRVGRIFQIWPEVQIRFRAFLGMDRVCRPLIHW